MLVIGLTGGIGSGKSTVASLFAQLSVPIIDADVIAKNVTQTGQPSFLAIVKHFGTEILLENGALNRAMLRKIIFKDTRQRLWLENLLHPAIEKEIQIQIKKLSAPYCIIVIPLLIEVKSYSYIDRILVVDSSEKKQIERVALRDHLTFTEVKAIMQTQAQREDRLTKAHDVINNDGSMSDLEKQVHDLHQCYLKFGQQTSHNDV